MLKKFIFLPLMLWLFTACHAPQHNQPTLRIAISKAAPGDHYMHYPQWIKRGDSTIETVNLYPMEQDSALATLKSCHALLLSGGPDINPALYRHPGDTTLCGTADHRRDTLEMALLRQAYNDSMPVLGICRGLQMINIIAGGTLYADIPTQQPNAVTHRAPTEDGCLHNIHIVPGTLLHQLAGDTIAQTNSNHHQGIQHAGKEITIIATTADGIAEAIAPGLNSANHFWLAVQWHPERMPEENPLSRGIRKLFLKKATHYLNSRP